jgi:bifunctional Delta-12/omega-3 fatty acid desaturase
MWATVAFWFGLVPLQQKWEAEKTSNFTPTADVATGVQGHDDRDGKVTARTGKSLPSTRAAAEPMAVPSIKALREAIPPHCFKPSLWTSCSYLLRDMVLVAGLAWAAVRYIPLVEDPLGRAAAWGLYGFVQGLFFTGLWILAHECGHGAFSLHQRANNYIGWAVHSFLLVPFFSWKYSHARHHQFTGHMDKDLAFVPRTRDQHEGRRYLGVVRADLFDDLPVVTLLQLLSHQLFGWQAYLLFNVTAGPASGQREGARWWRRSHFDPWSGVFRPSEAFYIFMSDVGILCMLSLLYLGAGRIGAGTMFLLYAVPYFWVHHWLGKYLYANRSHICRVAAEY